MSADLHRQCVFVGSATLGLWLLLTSAACGRSPPASPPADPGPEAGGEPAPVRRGEASGDADGVLPCGRADGAVGPVADVTSTGSDAAVGGSDSLVGGVDAVGDSGAPSRLADSGADGAALDAWAPNSAPPDGGAAGVIDVAGAKDAIPAELQGLCPGLLPNLPEPGAKCTKQGEVRCTNQGAYPKKLLWTTDAVQKGVCVRPFRVVCEKTAAGALVWQAHKCNTKDPLTNPTTCAGFLGFGCQENARGTRCCPLHCTKLAGGSPLGGAAVACPQVDYGTVLCHGDSPFVKGCGFVDDFPKGLSFNLASLGACADVCKDCTYWWATEKCKDHTCPKAFPGVPFPPPVYGKCIVKDGKPKCTESCAEAGAPGYW